MKNHRMGLVSVLLLTVTALAFTEKPIFAADSLESAKKVRTDSQREAVASQKKIDSLATETQRRLEEYRAVLHRVEEMKEYNDHLERLVTAQQEQRLAIERQMNTARETQRQIIPLINRMVEVLAGVVRLDMPFLLQERRQRVENLRKLVDDPNIHLPDKYRRVMEAYQIEMDFGRNIEAYTAELKQDGQERMVEFLRVGRVALLYMTFDGNETGCWDKTTGKWIVLARSFNPAVAKGLQIAKKQAPPELIRIPVNAPEPSR